MRRVVVSIVGAIWAALLSTTVLAQDPLAVRLDAAMAREHAAGRFDGVVLVGQGDELVFQRAIGLADRARQRPHSLQQAWRWASVRAVWLALGWAGFRP